METKPSNHISPHDKYVPVPEIKPAEKAPIAENVQKAAQIQPSSGDQTTKIAAPVSQGSHSSAATTVAKTVLPPPPLARSRGSVSAATPDAIRAYESTCNELFEAVQGTNEKRGGVPWKEPVLLPNGETVMLTRQGAKDIDRQPVTIGAGVYNTVPIGANAEAQNQERRLALFDAVRDLVQHPIDNTRAGEVISFLCAQTASNIVQNVVQSKCKPGTVAGQDPDPRYRNKYTLTANENQLIFTFETHYKTVDLSRNKKFQPEQFTALISVRIPKQAVVNASLEQLPEDVVSNINYQITKK